MISYDELDELARCYLCDKLAVSIAEEKQPLCEEHARMVERERKRRDEIK